MEKLAVIDLGSNSIRMSIFEIRGKEFKTLNAYRSTIGLSRGMSEDMRIREDAQSRAVEAVLEYRKILEEKSVDNVIFVATAAVRKAKNREEFLELMKRETGFLIKVISGEQEAAIDALVVRETLGVEKGIICDIGGGSTELISVDGENKISIPFGCRNITEMFLAGGESKSELKAAREFLKGEYGKVEWLKAMRGQALVGIGGTFRCAARFDMGDTTSGLIEKHIISTSRMNEILEEIIKCDPKTRGDLPGIGKDREDIILGGALFVDELIKQVEPREFVIADIGVREGVALDFVQCRGII